MYHNLNLRCCIIQCKYNRITDGQTDEQVYRQTINTLYVPKSFRHFEYIYKYQKRDLKLSLPIIILGHRHSYDNSNDN